MKKAQKELLVLKIGGSVITYKNNKQIKIRKTLLQSIAKEIKNALKNRPNTELILVHGAGSAGHVLASKFGLKNGVKQDKKKLKAALQIRENNQRLNLELVKIFSEAGLMVVPLHTGSVITQQNGEVDFVNYDLITSALREGCIPVLYGEMVFDNKLGLSVCSGDEIVSSMAHTLSAKQVLYASDVDGIYEEDPYKNKLANMIEAINLSDINSGELVKLGGSHSIDVTGGLFNKVKSLIAVGIPKSLEEMIVFNGLKENNFKKVLAHKAVGSTIYIKK